MQWCSFTYSLFGRLAVSTTVVLLFIINSTRSPGNSMQWIIITLAFLVDQCSSFCHYGLWTMDIIVRPCEDCIGGKYHAHILHWHCLCILEQLFSEPYSNSFFLFFPFLVLSVSHTCSASDPSRTHMNHFSDYFLVTSTRLDVRHHDRSRRISFSFITHTLSTACTKILNLKW